MKKWYIDDVFVREGRIYDRGYYVREDGMVEWREPFEGGRTFEFPVSECFHEDGTPVTVEDGELIGDLCAGWDAVQAEDVIIRREDYPVRDEAYLVGRAEDGRYFFAWGQEIPYSEKVPGFDILDGESGISFHDTLADALDAYTAAVQTVLNTDARRVQFVVDARRYFEIDAERLDQVEDGDEVLVTVDFSERRATYVWYGAGENPANFPEEEDDFEAVVDRFQKEIIENI